jgi:hypothetical protein
LLHVVFLASLTAAGATGPASLSCKSPGHKEGALTLRGLIPATQPALDLTLAQGADTLTFSAEHGDQVRVVEAFDRRLFTLTVTPKEGGELVLRAVPRSIRTRRDPYAVHATFDAVLVHSPRPGGGASVTNGHLTCLYDYEV